MPLDYFAGFDLYPATMSDATTPAPGSGLDNTPLRYGDTSVGSPDCALGVSDLESDMFGTGNERYRALVLDRKGTPNTSAYAFAMNTGSINTTAMKSFLHRRVFGFAFKDLSNPNDPPSNFPIVGGVMSGSTSGNVSLLSLSPDRMFRFGNVFGTGIYCEQGREYYIELEVTWLPPASTGANFPVTLRAYVDDELVATTNLFTTRGNVAAVSLVCRYGYPQTSSSDTSKVRYGFAHMYRTSRHTTEDESYLYAGRLGPQKVQLVGLKEVVENQGWSTVGASSEVDAISGVGRHDAEQYVGSPEDEGELRFRLDLPTSSRSVIHALDFMTTASRDGAAARMLTTDLVDSSGNAIISGNMATTPGPVNGRLFTLKAGHGMLAAENLKHTVLAASDLVLRAPVA